MGASILCRFQDKLSWNHPDVAEALETVADVYLALDRSKEAEAKYAEALAASRAAQPVVHEEVAERQSKQGACFTSQGRAEEAEPLLKEGLQVIRQARGDKSWRTAAAAGRLVALYRKTGRDADAAPYQSLLATKSGAPQARTGQP
jgi:tetratricopeptide (TPR) repeat protein